MLSDKLRQHNEDVVDKKRRPNYRILLLTLLGPIITSIVLFTIHFVGAAYDNKVLHWILFAALVPFLIMSLFLLQKYELVGPYGETIILLIPTLIWLLPGSLAAHKDSFAIWWIILMSFALTGILILGVTATVLTFTLKGDRTKRVLVATMLMRFMFIFSSIVSTLMISILLINWGHHSLHLLPIAKDGMSYETSSTSWVLFIIVNSILVATTLIALGLVSKYQKNKEEHKVKVLHNLDKEI